MKNSFETKCTLQKEYEPEELKTCVTGIIQDIRENDQDLFIIYIYIYIKNKMKKYFNFIFFDKSR